MGPKAKAKAAKAKAKAAKALCDRPRASPLQLILSKAAPEATDTQSRCPVRAHCRKLRNLELRFSPSRSAYGSLPCSL
jgi:hypothetical protein